MTEGERTLLNLIRYKTDYFVWQERDCKYKFKSGFKEISVPVLKDPDMNRDVSHAALLW
jgi:hypothetical protein